MMDLLDCADDHRRGALDGPAHQVPWAAVFQHRLDARRVVWRAGGASLSRACGTLPDPAGVDPYDPAAHRRLEQCCRRHVLGPQAVWVAGGSEQHPVQADAAGGTASVTRPSRRAALPGADVP